MKYTLYTLAIAFLQYEYLLEKMSGIWMRGKNEDWGRSSFTSKASILFSFLWSWSLSKTILSGFIYFFFFFYNYPRIAFIKHLCIKMKLCMHWECGFFCCIFFFTTSYLWNYWCWTNNHFIWNILKSVCSLYTRMIWVSVLISNFFVG